VPARKNTTPARIRTAETTCPAITTACITAARRP
jgi:hypothetical protein